MAAELVRRVGQEIHEARVASGLSQKRLGSLVGLSHAEISRLEHGLVPNAGVLVMARCFAVLGMRLSAKAYPEGPPVRDVAHARLLTRLRAQLHPSLRMRYLVPLHATEGDLRAWDGEIARGGVTCKVEAETRLYDLQAQQRRIALKSADSRDPVVILLVAHTHGNVAVLKEFRSSLRDQFPLGTRAVLRAFRSGEIPAASGICVL